MQSPALAGVRAKFNWAKKHAQYIGAAVDACLGGPPEVNRNIVPPFEYDDERHLLIINAPNIEPLDPSLALAFGDCVHNLRSALDHLVCQLAVLNGTPAIESRTAFPITVTRAEFENSIKRVAPYISAEALTVIQELQPYHSGDIAHHSVLRVLSQLDIIDKHRLIVVVVIQSKPIGFSITLPEGDVINRRIDSNWKPLKDGAELIRFDLSRTIKGPGKVHVKLETEASVFLAETGTICDNKILKLTLENFFRVVGIIIDDFGRRFFGE